MEGAPPCITDRFQEDSFLFASIFLLNFFTSVFYCKVTSCDVTHSLRHYYVKKRGGGEIQWLFWKIRCLLFRDCIRLTDLRLTGIRHWFCFVWILLLYYFFFLKYAKYFRKKMLFLGGFHDLVLRLRQRVNPFKCRPALLAEICFPHSQQEVNVLNFIIHETVYFMRIKKISTFKLNLSLCFTIIYVVMRLKSTH